MFLLSNNTKITTSDYIETNNIKRISKLNSAVIIPALNPTLNLIDFVHDLIKTGVPCVIVVNDGSGASYNGIFTELKKFGKCTVLEHVVNRGKGRALKTAITYFIENYSYLDGVVTADADGQHAINDICKICEKLSNTHGSLILGERNFKESNVPKRSYLGNTVTSCIFKFLYNSDLNDTQTGLRGIPKKELPWILELKGERYDFEINMLINARRNNINLKTIPIQTIYFENNSGSHYSTIKDSIPIFLKLISGLIQYSGSTIVSSILDVSAFFILNTFLLSTFPAAMRIFLSTAIARLISSMCNFAMNRRFIFSDTGKVSRSVLRYYILCVCLMMTSYGLVYSISLFWKVNESFIKLITDFILGFLSYEVQLRWVFQNKNNDESSIHNEVAKEYR